MGRRWVSRLLRKAIMAVAGALVVPAVPLHAHGMESFWAIWEPCPSSFSGFGMRFEEFHGRITEHFRQKSKPEIDEIFESDSEEGDALRLFAPVVVEPMEMAIFHLDCWADYRRFMRNSELEQLGQAHESYLRWRSCLQDGYRHTPLPKGFTNISSCYESIEDLW